MTKKILSVVGILLLAVLIWRIGAAIFAPDKAKRGKPVRPPVAVEVDSVRYGPITEVRQLTGTVFPKYRYVLAPKVTGRVISIKKRIGDWVKAGEIVARIDNAEYEQSVMEVEANLKIAKASLAESRIQCDLAKQEKERVESLQAKGIASAAELDAAVSNYSAQESRLELAKAQVEQREASLEASKIRLNYTVLAASKPGFIGERFVDEGALLAPNAAVVSIIAIDSVIVRTTITERDYDRIRAGQPAQIRVDTYRGRSFTGTVSRIAPMLSEASRVAQMEVELDNDSLLLKPGMFARVDVVTARKEHTPFVRSLAVVNRGAETGIFTVNSGESVVHYVPVQTGIITAEYTEIISPALEGLVITLGQHLLDSGSPVILPGASAGKAATPHNAQRGEHN